MFDLEQALADRRRKLNEAGVKAPIVLDELESHLRDQIEEFLHSGLDERQAFETALERIGRVEILGCEFGKSERKLLKRLALGFVALYSLVGGGAALFKLGSFSDISSTQQISALAAVLIANTLIFSGPVFARIFPVISERRMRAAIYVIGVLLVFVWLAVFYHHIMTRVEWDMSQLVVALLWAWTSMAVLAGGIFGMEEAAAGRPRIPHV